MGLFFLLAYDIFEEQKDLLVGVIIDVVFDFARLVLRLFRLDANGDQHFLQQPVPLIDPLSDLHAGRQKCDISVVVQSVVRLSDGLLAGSLDTCFGIGPVVDNLVGDAIDKMADGDPVVIDGETGEILIRPTEEERKSYDVKIKKQEELKAHYAELKELPAITTDGVKVELVANIGHGMTLEVGQVYHEVEVFEVIADDVIFQVCGVLHGQLKVAVFVHKHHATVNGVKAVFANGRVVVFEGDAATVVCGVALNEVSVNVVDEGRNEFGFEVVVAAAFAA